MSQRNRFFQDHIWRVTLQNDPTFLKCPFLSILQQWTSPFMLSLAKLSLAPVESLHKRSKRYGLCWNGVTLYICKNYIHLFLSSRSDCLGARRGRSSGKQHFGAYAWTSICLHHVVIQSLSRVWLFTTRWMVALQASLSFISWSLLKLMSIVSMMPSITSSSAAPFSSCSQSFPASGSFPTISSLHQLAKVLELQLQHQSFQWIFRVDFL